MASTPPPKKTKAEQAEATINTLLEVATRTFASVGYANASMETVVQAAHVTRGALYHHFSSKQGLFLAVLERIQNNVANRILHATATQPDAWGQLVTGCHEFLVASTDPTTQQIMLLDGPAVLGWQTWRKIDAETSGRLLLDILRTLSAEGQLKPLPVVAMSQLLGGAMNEAALWIAQSPQPQHALQEATHALDVLLNGLRA